MLNTLIHGCGRSSPFSHTVEVFTAGAPPAAATLKAIEPLGFNITQVYGLTETYGPPSETLWQQDWDALPEASRYEYKVRTVSVCR